MDADANFLLHHTALQTKVTELSAELRLYMTRDEADRARADAERRQLLEHIDAVKRLVEQLSARMDERLDGHDKRLNDAEKLLESHKGIITRASIAASMIGTALVGLWYTFGNKVLALFGISR